VLSKICDFGLGFIVQLGRLAVSRHPVLADRMLELFEHAQKARNVVGTVARALQRLATSETKDRPKAVSL
jgi:hypothetical protein